MSDTPRHDIMTYALDDQGVPIEVPPVDTLVAGLESDDHHARMHAAKVASGAAKSDPEFGVDLVPTLVDGLEDHLNHVVVHSTMALAVIAEEAPGVLEPAVPRLTEQLSSEYHDLQYFSARALGFVSLDEPELLADHVDALLEALQEEPSELLDSNHAGSSDLNQAQRRTLQTVNEQAVSDQSLARKIVANALVEVARSDPGALEGHASALIELLADQDTNVVVAITDVVGELARENPAAVTEAVEPLCELLGHPDDSAAANAVTALGFLDDPAAVEPLRRLERDAGGEGRTETLRELAGETADFIET